MARREEQYRHLFASFSSRIQSVFNSVRRSKILEPFEPARWPLTRVKARLYAFVTEPGMLSPARKKKFKVGAVLALWPVAMVALVPSKSLINTHSYLLAASGLPLAILCLSALFSETAAFVVFFQLRRRSKDRLRLWSTIAAAAAGEASLAFLIAAVANLVRAW